MEQISAQPVQRVWRTLRGPGDQPTDDAVGLAERHAFAHQVLGQGGGVEVAGVDRRGDASFVEARGGRDAAHGRFQVPGVIGKRRSTRGPRLRNGARDLRAKPRRGRRGQLLEKVRKCFLHARRILDADAG